MWYVLSNFPVTDEAGIVVDAWAFLSVDEYGNVAGSHEKRGCGYATKELASADAGVDDLIVYIP